MPNRATTRPPRISLCMIVRDEEANLPRCLASVAGKVDEIVVVDTGSRDRTVDIARSFGAKTFSFEWCDDFAAARNESLRHATGDFILWIDADDELVERHAGALRRLRARSGEWGWFLDVHCPASDQAPETTVVRQWRLFPRAAGVHFEGRIHEHPVAPRVIRAEDVGVQDEVHVVHWGYTASGEAMRRRLERNRRLIERCIADEPHQPRHYFNLGCQLVAEGQDERALATQCEGIERWFQAHGADTGYVPPLFSMAAAAANRLGRHALALELGGRAPQEFVSSELLLEMGVAAHRLGQDSQAVAHWNRAATDQRAIGNIFSDREAPRKALQAIQALRPAPVVSACLIVKNEEADLPRCLASIRDAVDEIVVVDTGSTDRTVEVAQSFGARTFEFEWCDDFSAARNESLRHASGEFILWVDADDELETSHPDALRELCRALPAGSWGYWVDVLCPADEWQESVTIVKQARLFRNRAGVAFGGRLHEQTSPPPGYKPDALTHQSGFRIKHWGYIPAAPGAPRRSERNRRLLQLAIEEHPDEHFHYYNLGLQYAGDREFALGLATFQCAIDLWRRNPGPHNGHVPSMFAMAALCAVEVRDYAKAIELEASVPPEHISADLVYHAGLAYWALDQADQAIVRFERALREPALADHNAHDRSTSTWRPLVMLASVYLEKEDFASAYAAAAQALEFAPTRPDALYLRAYSAYRLGRLAEAVEIARRALAERRDEGYQPKLRRLLLNLANDLDDASLALAALEAEVEGLSESGAAFLRAKAYGMLGDQRRQCELLLEACVRFPADPDIRLGLSELLESQQRPEEALGVLLGALEHQPVSPRIYQRLAASLARQGRLEDAATALELAARA